MPVDPRMAAAQGSLTTDCAVDTDVAAIRTVLLSHPAVAECVVVDRGPADSRFRLVAYAVPTTTVSPERLRAYADAAVGRALPLTVVAIARLPLTPDGDLDEPALERIPVIDEEVVARWREAVAAIPDVSVTVGGFAERPGRLHLSTLLPARVQELAPDDAPSAPSARIAPCADVGSLAPSVSQGDAVREDCAAPATLAGALQRAARLSADKGLRFLRTDGTETRLSYPALLARAERISGGLQDLGLRPGDKALFQFDDAEDFTAAFWGCVLAGIVPVPLAVPPSYAVATAAATKLQNVRAMLKGPVVLSNGAAAADVRALASSPDMAGLRVRTLSDLLDSPTDGPVHESAPGDLALLLLTSGSTGVPKAVMQSHAAVLCRSAAATQMFGLTRDDVLLNWLPIDHVGGVVMTGVLGVWLGCDQIHGATTSVLQDPLRWLDWIDRYRVTSTWAPNFAYALVNAHADEIDGRGWDLSCLRVLINGGEAVVAKTARRFLSLLTPHGLGPRAIHPVFGMSETCSGVTFNRDFSLDTTSDDDVFVDLGGPLPGFAMRIADADDRPVPEGAIGGLQMHGPFVTTGYFDNAAANREAFTKDGWFRSGDLGLMRDGRLTITGREKDVIIINGVNYYSHDIEKGVEEIPGVEVWYAAAFAARARDIDTDQLAICFTPSARTAGDDALAALVREIRARIAQRVGVHPTYLVPVERDEIPKTTIGKIQRSELARRLKAGDFDAILRRVDLLLENARTVPDWFSRRVWRPRRLAAASARPPCRVLAFIDEEGIGGEAIAALAAAGSDCVAVTRGSGFARVDTRAYVVAPGEPAGYAQLMDALARDGFAPDLILHCWTADGGPAVDSVSALEAAQHVGLLSLLGLAQALARRDDERRVVVIVASKSACVLEEGESAGPHATLPGLLKTIPQELPHVACRHVDLDGSASSAAAARAILDEIEALDGEPEVAYRAGVRYVSRLAPLDLAAGAKGPLRVKPGGCYLVTGGLGALGALMARELLEGCHARLLLLGRTPLDGPDELSRRRAAELDRLRAAGDVVYEAVDVADAAALTSAVNRARERWQHDLDGIVHLAGEHEARLIAEESPAHVLAAIRAKLSGTWALRQLVAGRSDALFLAFSSVNGLFGGLATAAYSAANAYLDASAEAERRRGAPAASLAWSLWDDVGVSRGYAMKDLSRSRGYLPIGTSDGRASLLAALQAADGHLLIGLNLTSPHIRRFVDGPARPVQQVVVAARGASADVVDELAALDVRDRFGQAVPAAFVREGAGSGASDAVPGASGSTGTDLERSVVRIWQQVLEVGSVDLDANFFELGGTSLLMAQAYRRIKEVGGPHLALTDLFRYPTVRTLCRYLAAGGHADPEATARADRERGRRRRDGLRRLARPGAPDGNRTRTPHD